MEDLKLEEQHDLYCVLLGERSDCRMGDCKGGSRASWRLWRQGGQGMSEVWGQEDGLGQGVKTRAHLYWQTESVKLPDGLETE